MIKMGIRKKRGEVVRIEGKGRRREGDKTK